MTIDRDILKICLIIFVLSFGVRLVTWENNKTAAAEVQWVVTQMYTHDAGYLAGGDLRSFITGPDPPSDASILTHPPGYSILMAPVFAVGGDVDMFRLLQILLSSLAPVLVFLIVLQPFGRTTASVAGALTVLSPQSSYYAGILLPDGLCALPILGAVYLFTRALKDPSLMRAAGIGALLALSCWLRSNAMMMVFAFVLIAFFVVAKEVRLKFAVTLLAAFVLAIAPITIRNAIVFKSFIPLSLGMGHMLVIGLGEYGNERGLDLPRTDVEDIILDARRYGRPDYEGLLFSPDGVKRERERTSLALGIIKNDPVWYASTVVRRSPMTFRMERVPVIAPERDERASTPTLFYYVGRPLKLLQRAFITAVFLPLFLMGVWLAFRDKGGRMAALILLAVPIYYMCFQSLIYTEYRFVAPATFFIIIFASVALVAVVRKLTSLMRRSSEPV